MDWSPPNERLQRKRFASPNVAIDNENIPHELELINEVLEPDAKRFHDINNPIETSKKPEDDMEMLAENVNHSIDDNNNISDNSLEVSANSFHEVRGPISARRIHDSGFNMTNEIPYSSFNSTNNSNASNDSSVSSINLESSVSLLANSMHEIRGPVSVRRIHDSGVNLSTEMNHSSFINNSNESSHYFENSAQISGGSAAHMYEYEDDSEPSI